MIIEVELLCLIDSPTVSLSDLPQTSCAPIVLHMYKKFDVNRSKIRAVSLTQKLDLKNLGVI